MIQHLYDEHGNWECTIAGGGTETYEPTERERSFAMTRVGHLVNHNPREYSLDLVRQLATNCEGEYTPAARQFLLEQAAWKLRMRGKL